MNKQLKKKYRTKAGLIPCLFLSLLFFSDASAREWTVDANTKKAYNLVLNLQTQEALQLLPSPATAPQVYVTALAQAIELLITEDKEKFELYEHEYEKRLEQKTTSSAEENLFLKAELRLQWMFVYLKFGHELDAALNLRECFHLVKECKKQFPGFTPIYKTSGILQVLIGSIPEKYNWILNLLGMDGSVTEGLSELQQVAQPNNPFFLEATVIHSFIRAYALQDTEMAFLTLKGLQAKFPENKTLFMLGAAMALKNSQSEEAVTMLDAFDKLDPKTPIAFVHYLRGETYLHKANYANAIAAFDRFLTLFKGKNCIKDAYFKIGICYWLNGNPSDAELAFNNARNNGTESGEADRYAARSLAEDELPNIPLTKARYYMDGGYYKEAKEVLENITSSDLKTTRDRVEYSYRRARLAHKMGQVNDAKQLYEKVISQSEDSPWYFAPNACLQLGYLAMEEKNEIKAQDYFRKALKYQRHPYKNSIDSKAKSALAQLKTRK